MGKRHKITVIRIEEYDQMYAKINRESAIKITETPQNYTSNLNKY